jgi:hypothetical protein
VIARPLQQIEDDLGQGKIALDEAITELADAQRDDDIACLLGPRMSLPDAAVRRVLDAPAEEPAAMLCRAAGLSVNGYSAILRMRRRMRPCADPPASVLLAGYRQLPRAKLRDLGPLLEAAAAS